MVSAVVMIWPGVSRKRSMHGVGGDGGVAGQAGAQGGDEGLGQHAEGDVEVDVEVDGLRTARRRGRRG